MSEQWPPEPTVDDFIADKGESFRLNQLQYMNWLRVGVRNLLDEGMTPRQIKENWPELRKNILRKHGYLSEGA